jgi:cytochrome c oxidase assembly factor CtaG
VLDSAATWVRGLSFDPAGALVLALAAGLYLAAQRRLARRGRRVPAWQRTAWWAGIGLGALGLLSPLDPLADELLSAHMVQHLLIADLAAPLLLAGLRSPMLQFLLPAPALRRLARLRRLRSAMRVLRRPLVAIPVYVGVLYGWHLGFMFEGALESPAVHAVQHQSFVAASVLVWWAPLEPKRARVPGELWKIGHVLGARLAGMFLGMAFIALRAPVYVGAYGEGPRAFGLSGVVDQQIAGGLMLSLDLAVMLGALAFFFARAGQDHDRAEGTSARAPSVATSDG